MSEILYKCDAYKLNHKNLYYSGVVNMYSMFYARNNKKSNIKDNKFISICGVENFIYELNREWSFFFNLNDEEVKTKLDKYEKFNCELVGITSFDTTHLYELYKLQYLPLEIRLIDVSEVPYQIPILTISNTIDSYFWLVNYIESYLLNKLWLPMTSATTAREFYSNFKDAFTQSGIDINLIPIYGHDFSLRGMGGDESAVISGLGHLKHFTGSDNLPALRKKQFFEPMFKGCCVIATEHSVATSYGKNGESILLKNILDNYSGILSFVADTYDYFYFIDNIVRKYRDDIKNFNGKIVIRPDSGNHIDILCGDKSAEIGSPEYKGTFNLLWEIFGGTINTKGFKVLDKHIGIICGDSMSINLQKNILQSVMNIGYAPDIVIGIGATTYQDVNRDTHSFAFKATAYMDRSKNIVPMSKKPKTDANKSSLSGLLYVYYDNNSKIAVKQNASLDEYKSENNMLKIIYKDGVIIKDNISKIC